MSRVHLRRFVVSQLKCLVVAAPLILIVGGPTGPTPAVAQDSVDRDRQPVFTAGEVAHIVTGRFASDLRYAAGGIERTLDRAEYKLVRASRVELVEKLRAAATAAETFKDTNLTEAKLKDAQKVLAVALRDASEAAGNAQARAGNAVNGADQAVDAKAQELAAAEQQLEQCLQQACTCVENFGWARTPQAIQAGDGLLQSAIYRSGLVAQSVGLLALNTVQPTASLLASDLRQSAQAIEQTIPKIADKAQAAAQQDLCNKLRQAADSCDAMNNVPQADMAKVHQTLATALADAGKAVAKVEGLKGEVLNKVEKVEDGVEHHLAGIENRLGQILSLASACCAERAIATTQQAIAAAERDLFRTVRWTADAARDLACCATGTIASVEAQLACQLHNAVFQLERTIDNTKDKALATTRQALCDNLRLAAQLADKATNTAKSEVAKVHQTLAAALNDAAQAVAKVEGLKGDVLNKVDKVEDSVEHHLAAVENRLGQILQLACACVAERAIATTQQAIDKAERDLMRTVNWTADAARDLACCATGTIASVEGQLACQLHNAVFQLERTIDNTKDKALATARQALCDDLRLAAQLADKATNTAKSEVAKVHQTLAAALNDAAQAVAKVEGLKGDVLNKVDKVEDSVEHHLAAVESRLGQILQLACACVAERALATTQQAIDKAERDLMRTVNWTADAARDLACCATGTIASVKAQLACQLHNAVFQLERTIDNTKDKALATARQALCDDLRLAAQLADKATNTAKSEVAKVHQTLATALADAAQAVAKVEGLKGDVLNKVDGVEDKVEDTVARQLAGVENRLGQILQLASACCVQRAIANTEQAVAAAERNLMRTVNWTADAARDLACCATGTIASVEGQLACQLHNAVFQLERTIESTKDKALATAQQALCDDLRLAAQLADKATNTATSEVAKVHQTLATALADAGKAVAKVEGLKGDVLNKADKIEDEAARELASISRTISNVQINGNVLANVGVSVEGSAKVGNLLNTTADVNSTTQAAIKLRGAIHEAFAKPYVSHVDLVTVTAQTPPADLKEQAAASAVAKGMTFVGGYWNWNSVDGKFDWVNGISRRAPAGCHWMPGEWVQTDNGFARVPGAWVSDKSSAASTVQGAAAITDLGKHGTRPGVDRFWIPPSNANLNGKLQESAGFWAKSTSQNSKLVWFPSQTIAMPGKTVFVNGYWDHRLTERGVLHAPVDISEGANSQAASALASVVKLDMQRVFLHTFVDEKTQHYLFGNFYGAAAEQAGIKSWVASATGVNGYDPLFEHYDRTYAAAGGNLAARLMGWNQFFQQNPQLCPPATLPELAQFLKVNPSGQARTAAVLVSGLDAQAGRQLVAAGDLDGKQLTMLQGTLGSLNSNLVSVDSLTGTGTTSLTNLTGSTSVLGGTVGGLSGNLGLGNTGAGAIGGLGGMTSIGGTGGLGGVGAVGGLGGVGGVAGGVGSVGGIGGASAVGGASGLLGGAGGVGGLLK